MPKTAMIRARAEPELKLEAESIFLELGLTQTDAINLFYRQVVLHRGLPFRVAIPNATTRAAIEAARRGDDRQAHPRARRKPVDLGARPPDRHGMPVAAG